MFSQNTHYAKVCLQHEVLPKIVGAPSFGKLKDLNKFVRDNAASAQSELGGGSHLYLEMVGDDASF